MTPFLLRFSSSNLHFRRGCANVHRLIFVIAALSANVPLHANTISVDDASSGSVAGKCTIQDAVKAANTNAAVNGCTAGSVGLDTIQFAAGISSIVLDAPMTPPAGSVSANCIYGLAISEDLSIDGAPVPGNGIPKVTIQRSASAATHFGVVGASIYDCGKVPGSKLNLTLSGLTISNGNVDGLFIGSGGGVTSDFLTISDSVISGNAAASGGGVYAFTSLSMNTSTVSNNTATFSCAGICGVAVTIYGSTISGNVCSGYGGGGGIGANMVNIVNSTVSGNSAYTGGGSGIDTTALQATWVTITANKGTGWYLGVGGTSSLSHTVIVGNGDGSTTHDFDTSFSTTVGGDHNWIGTFSTVAHNDLNNSLLILSCATPALAPLANNGGGTQTHALLPGSCLIDAGGITSPIPNTLILYDQRGSGFARFVNANSDIGAFEFQGGVTPVNGACGADNGQTLPIAPTHLCSAGIASAIAGAGHPWSWTCASASGGTTATCAATIKTWTVTATPASGGSISPTSQTVDSGASTMLAVSPAAGYRITSVSGCGGTLNGNDYTTAAIIADCAITAVFSVAPAPSAPVNVPFLSPWMLLLLGVALLGVVALGSRKSPLDPR